MQDRETDGDEAARVEAAGGLAESAGRSWAAGDGSGHGKTSGQGGEGGSGARAGGGSHPWFEGGQLPLHRRVPKRGFTNIFRTEYAVLNVKDLARFESGTAVTPTLLAEAGLVQLRGRDQDPG